MSSGETEPESSATAPAGSPPADDALAAARAEADQNREAVLRARADLENARRRHEKELQNALRYGAEGLIQALLPVRDSLDEALRAIGQTESAGLERFVEGTRLTLSLLDKALERAGVREVPASGRFDPAVHQAMAMQDSTDVPDGDVLQVVQKGFVLNDRLVRPAMVIVARAPGGG